MMFARKMFVAGLALALGFPLAWTASVASRPPQLPSPPSPPMSQQDQPGGTGPRIRSTVELVVVPVTVKDSQGQLVGDLRRDEFRVFEDGVEQQVSLFSVEAFPLSVVVAVDDDLRTRAADQVKKSLIAIAGAFSASDEVSIGRFDSFYTPVMDFTSDNDQLITELQRLDLNSSMPGVGSEVMTGGPTVNGRPAPGAPTVSQVPLGAGASTKHINDAVYQAAEILRGRDSQRRKMIILVSDGVNARNNTYSFDETLQRLLSSDISVYAIGVDSAVIERGATVLSRYARATGGDVYYAARAATLPKFYAQVAEQARHQYTIGYLPAQTDRSKSYHSIEVRIRRPGLTLLTREGYYTGVAP